MPSSFFFSLLSLGENKRGSKEEQAGSRQVDALLLITGFSFAAEVFSLLG